MIIRRILMSSSLGPIHYWLYNKIRFQEEVTAAIADAYPDNGKSLEYKKDLPDLEDAVDMIDIHGSLQGMINDAESRNAKLVTGLLSNGVKLSDIEDTVYAAGEKHSVKANNAREAYKSLDDLLLNGMPCDRVVVITGQDDNEVKFSLAEEIHGDSWQKAGGDVNVYYKLRCAAANGILVASGFELSGSEDNKDYTIKRK